MQTADLCDAYGDLLQYVEPIFQDFGKKTVFGGKISTVKCHEDNSFVKLALSESGEGRVSILGVKFLSLVIYQLSRFVLVV